MFSKTYLKQAATERDSERFRNRLAARAADRLYRDGGALALFVRCVEQETGVRFPGGIATWDVESFFRDADIRDVLDSVTCARRALRY